MTLAEQLLGHVVSDDREARHLLLVSPREIAAVLELDGANVLIRRLDAGDAGRRGVVGALHADGAALELRADDGDHRRLGLQRAGIVEGQEDLAAGPLATGLKAGPAAPDNADVLAQLAQDFLVAAAKAFAGRRQDDHRDHSPEDPEHRQAAAQLVRAQILESLCQHSLGPQASCARPCLPFVVQSGISSRG